MEIWKDVVGYEGVYSVSNLGRVRRDAPAPFGKSHITYAGKILKTNTNGRGYCTHCIANKKTIYAHRFVAEAFLGSRIGFDINHKDGNKTNNNIENLEYVTHKENMAHAGRSGLMARGSSHSRTKLTNEDIIDIRKRYDRKKKTVGELAKEYSICKRQVWSIATGHSWKHL